MTALVARLRRASRHVDVHNPDVVAPKDLAQFLEREDPVEQIRALRSNAVEQTELSMWIGLLHHGVPGIRKAAALGLGRSAIKEAQGPLSAAAAAEACDMPRLTMAVAAARCGLAEHEARAIWLGGPRRRIATANGIRSFGEISGLTENEAILWWLLALGQTSRDGLDTGARHRPISAAAVRHQLTAAVYGSDTFEHKRWLESALASQQHVDDWDSLVQWTKHAGRSGRVGAWVNLGFHGDPRSFTTLREELFAVGREPGLGFALRRAVVLSIGRLGVPMAGETIWDGFVAEQRDYEGRPGAGMGVQYPVRAACIDAMGESGAKAMAGRLTALLGETSGTALGGLFLPAMLALVKLGDPTPVVQCLNDGEVIAANAIGVLAGMGLTEHLQRAKSDPRPLVAQTAAAAELLAVNG